MDIVIIGDIARHHAQPVIRLPRHQVAFEYLVDFLHRVFERFEPVFGLRDQADFDEYVQLHADFLVIELGHIALYRAGLFKQLHPPMACRWRQCDSLRQVVYRYIAVHLQLFEQSDIGTIHGIISI